MAVATVLDNDVKGHDIYNSPSKHSGKVACICTRVYVCVYVHVYMYVQHVATSESERKRTPAHTDRKANGVMSHLWI